MAAGMGPQGNSHRNRVEVNRKLDFPKSCNIMKGIISITAAWDKWLTIVWLAGSISWFGDIRKKTTEDRVSM